MSSNSRAVEGAEGNVSPDSYQVEYVNFYNNKDKGINISSFVQRIELFEDINHPFLEGIIYIQDAANFYEEQILNEASSHWLVDCSFHHSKPFIYTNSPV